MKPSLPITAQPEDELWNMYLEYNNPTEVPASYHRCGAMSPKFATMLNRQMLFSLGHFTVFPNMYLMLIGSPGTHGIECNKNLQEAIANCWL